MKNLEKKLRAVNKDLKTLSKKVDKMIEAIGKLEKPKVKAAKAKPAKKTVAKAKPVKKVAAKKAPVKKVAVKKPAAKKPTKTGIDTVLSIIKRSKKGVNTATLTKKTGFSEKQIQNNVYKLKKQGKIKTVGRGQYLQA